ncbi:hypothetical protein FVE85_3583 [Porphyridium purpureum]|uniref:Uncharacterized protein n=1 Tax=Porphyridium purpureum TaxID=35688 RepID=A0A5J4YLW9_PORPP|nr:hypothetical protein FVE85_3583 [Porphyridium purpureum]|eukprot:POR7207..scf249_10
MIGVWSGAEWWCGGKWSAGQTGRSGIGASCSAGIRAMGFFHAPRGDGGHLAPEVKAVWSRETLHLIADIDALVEEADEADSSALGCDRPCCRNAARFQVDTGISPRILEACPGRSRSARTIHGASPLSASALLASTTRSASCPVSPVSDMRPRSSSATASSNLSSRSLARSTPSSCSLIVRRNGSLLAYALRTPRYRTRDLFCSALEIVVEETDEERTMQQ